MGKSKIRTLLMACVMIMLCAAMIVGGTYALWTQNKTVTTHLKAGNLDVTLQRTGLIKCADGINETELDTSSVPTTANIFGLEDELIVPTAWYAARLELTNSGSVAIDYTINITVKDDTSDKYLAKQVKVYIGSENTEGVVTYPAEGQPLATGEDNNITFASQIQVGSGDLAKNASTSFWVKIVFENLGDTEEQIEEQNKSQNKTADFDLLIIATQKTAQSTQQ